MGAFWTGHAWCELVAVIVIAVGVVASAAPAQDTPGPTVTPAAPARATDEEDDAGTDVPADEQYATMGMDEIVVTAQKRREKVQDVPISITAMTSEFIADTGLTDFKNLEQYAPNVRVQPVTSTRSATISIRGIGTPGSNAGFDPSVGVFHDGIYLGRPGMALTELLDIERVEILRGPQGTLYGKNTAAGAINIITRKPSLNDFEAFAEGVIGNYDARQGRASVNVPIKPDVLAARVSGFTVVRDGFDRLLTTGERRNDQDRFGFRARTLYAPTDNFDLLITGDYTQEDNTCCVGDILTYEGRGSLRTVGATFADVAASTGRPLPKADGFDRVVDADADTANDVKMWGAAIEGNVYLANDDTLTSLSGYRGFQTDNLLDGDFSSYKDIVLATEEKFHQFSTELRLTSPSAAGAAESPWSLARLEYVGGLYFFTGQDDTVGRLTVEEEYLDASTFGQLFPQFDQVGNLDINDHRTFTYAAFGQATYKFLDPLHLTLGVRLNQERKTRDGSQTSDCTIVEAPPLCGADQELNQSRTVFNASPMASVRYFVTPEHMLYVAGARGFKSGGFNQLRTLTANVGSNTEFDDEISTNAELGAKTTWLDRRVTLNGTFFYTWYQDFQALSFDGTEFFIRNAADLRSYGIEGEFALLPHPSVQLGAGVGWNVAEYIDFDDAECTVDQLPDDINTDCSQDLSGRTKDDAPEWTANVFAQFQHAVPRLPWPILGYVRGEYAYRDNAYLAQDLDPHTLQSAYNLANFRIGARAADELWDVAFWIQNATDTKYLIAATDVPIHSGFFGVNGPPQTYGVTMRVRF